MRLDENKRAQLFFFKFHTFIGFSESSSIMAVKGLMSDERTWGNRTPNNNCRHKLVRHSRCCGVTILQGLLFGSDGQSGPSKISIPYELPATTLGHTSQDQYIRSCKDQYIYPMSYREPEWAAAAKISIYPMS